MNFFERKEQNKCAEINQGYFFRNEYGFETPIKFQGVIIKHHIADGVVKVRGIEKELTYEERQVKIDGIMDRLNTNHKRILNTENNCTTIFGKRLEDYTQKELYDVLKEVEDKS